jgi:hypothetical protein
VGEEDSGKKEIKKGKRRGKGNRGHTRGCGGRLGYGITITYPGYKI